MKYKLLRGGFAVILFTAFIVSCNLLPEGGLLNKTMPADEAKIEIRNANQEIMTNMELMMSTPAMTSLFYLMNIMPELMSADIKSADIRKMRLTYSNFLNNFRAKAENKSANDDEMLYGYYEFSFTYNDFVLVQESNSVLEFKYPADDAAYANRQNNAQLSISNLKFEEISSYEEYYDYYEGSMVRYETSEMIPVSASVTQRVDNTVVLTANYSASYNTNGMPVSMSAAIEMDTYSLNMSYSGNSTSYNTKMSYKMGKEELMAYDLKVKYLSDMESVDNINGYYTVSPLKLDGSLNFDAIDKHMETNYENPDIDFINKQISVDVFHTEEKAKIGKIEFRMEYDSYWEEYELVPVIVYNDDSYEKLDDIFALFE